MNNNFITQTRHCHTPSEGWLNKFLLTMKISIFLVLISTFSVTASVYSQNKKLNLDLHNVSVREALEKIEKQTDFRFFYIDEQIDVSRKVNLSAVNRVVDDVLAQLFSENTVKFKVFDNNLIVLSPNKENQQQEISGNVRDAKTGEALPGVNIMVKGTTTGTITDLDGNFTIKVPNSSATLVFSFIGYQAQSIAVEGRTKLDVKMQEDTKNLEEVVVVGYGTQKRSDITGSVTSVSKDRLKQLPVTNIAHALEGSTAGMQITQNSTVPGSSATMQVRGVNSINANTSPFIVLDGVPFFGTTNDINPSDIESIEILKDASSVAIYGTRGSNGVILITSKRGNQTQGKPKITYSGYVGLENIAHKLTPMSADAYVQKYKDYNLQNIITQTAILPNTTEVENYNKGITTDWLKETTQQGLIHDQNVNISGGTSNIQYYVSVGHTKQDGVVKGYQFEKNSVRTNIDAKITDFLKIGTSAFVTGNNYDGGRANWLLATSMSPYSVPYESDGTYKIYPMSPELLYTNPLLGLSVNRKDRGLNLTGNGYVEVTPNLVKGLKYRLNAAYVYNTGDTKQYSGRQNNDKSGTAEVSHNETMNWVLENILSYTKDIGKHHLDLTALYSAQRVDYYKFTSKSISFINDALSFYNLGAGATQSNTSEGNYYTLLSQMGRLNYSYDSRYLFSATARRDGYSAFGANTDKTGVFPSFALGWNIVNESFMKSLPIVDQLKLRYSYGITGNQAVPVNQTETTAGSVLYPFGGKVYSGILYSSLGNANLNWESTSSGNIGLDFGFFKSRISGTIEVYKSETNDLLLKRNLPNITGYTNVWANLGRIENKGIEVSVKTINISKNDFTWSTNFNFAINRNKILDLYGDGKDDKGNNWFIGQPIRVIYDYEKIGIWQVGEDVSKSDPVAIPGDIKFKDQNGDGKITSDDKIIIGQKDPKWTGGMTNTFSYKGISLSIFLQTSQGGLAANSDLNYADEAWRRNLPADYKYWTVENKDNYWPSLSAYKNYRGYQFAEDNSYIRIKDITLSYVVPQTLLSKYKIQSLTIFATGRNLYTYTKWFGWDPEMSYSGRGSGDWTNNYPAVRTVSLGVNISL